MIFLCIKKDQKKSVDFGLAQARRCRCIVARKPPRRFQACHVQLLLLVVVVPAEVAMLHGPWRQEPAICRTNKQPLPEVGTAASFSFGLISE